jgi:vitamin B12 transporter
LFQGCFADEPDLDGYRNLSLSLRGGVELSDTLDVEAHFLNAENDNEYDGSQFGGNETSNTQRVLGGKLVWSPGARVKVTAQAGRAIDKYHAYFREDATRRFVDNFDTRRDTASVQADLAIADGQLLSAGGDWQRDVVSSHTAFTVTDRDNTAAFVEYQGQFGAHQLQASVRNDDNEQFGNHATGSLGWGMALGGDFRFNASYGTGFKAPTFNDLYFPFGGNPGLEPEESKSLNLGIGQYAKGWNWTFNVYETRIDSLTGYDSFFNLVQVDKARIRGAELTYATSLAGWDLSTQLSYVDPRADARLTAEGAENPNYGNLLPRRAPRTGRIDIDRGFGDFRFGTTISGASARYDDAANSVRLAGYGTVDLRVEYAVTADWTVQARASNVFDREYETIAWYNQPGREYGLSLRYQPAR